MRFSPNLNPMRRLKMPRFKSSNVTGLLILLFLSNITGSRCISAPQFHNQKACSFRATELVVTIGMQRTRASKYFLWITLLKFVDSYLDVTFPSSGIQPQSHILVVSKHSQFEEKARKRYCIFCREASNVYRNHEPLGRVVHRRQGAV